MSNTQKATAKAKGKPGGKAQMEKAVVSKTGNGEPSAKKAGADFSPITLPVSGPLARAENVEKLSQLAQEAGIPLRLHVVTEEQRQGERRQAENDRRQREQQTIETAGQVEAILSGKIEGAEGEGAAEEEVETATEQAKPNLAAFQEEVSKLAEKFGLPAPTIGASYAATPRSGRPQKNGITRPGSDTTTGKVWHCADEITTKNKQAASISELKQHPDLRQVNDHTIRTQYARWRKYNGVEGRVDSGNSRANKDAVTQFKTMSDSTFMRFQEDDRKGELPEELRAWYDWEAGRRNAEREAKKNGVAIRTTDDVPQCPMTNAVYTQLCLLEKNSNLPAKFLDALAAEKERRGEK
jgi:hypothetical protein